MEGTYLGRCLVPVSQQEVGREGQYAWELSVKIVSQDSSPLPKAVTFPLSVGLRKVQEYSGAKPGRV